MKLRVSIAARRIAAASAITVMPFVIMGPARADDAAPPVGTYIWTWKHTKGQVERMQAVSRITAQVPGTDLKLDVVTTETLKETVTDIADNGDVSLEQTDEAT
ncbi:MAG: hypothetical protein M3Y56_16305, partial [Armatimonadota bacterium]|nr:hypothetical protein [Armatimonadota bacterium]